VKQAPVRIASTEFDAADAVRVVTAVGQVVMMKEIEGIDLMSAGHVVVAERCRSEKVEWEPACIVARTEHQQSQPRCCSRRVLGTWSSLPVDLMAARIPVELEAAAVESADKLARY